MSDQEKEMQLQLQINEMPLKLRIDGGIFLQEIWVRILLKLPVKTLCRFKLVSNSWLAFLSSSYFIKMHLGFGNSPERLLRVGLSSTLINTPEINFLKLSSDPAADDEDFSVHSPFHFNPFDEVVLEDSCNGLMGLKISSIPGIILWNPATRKFRCLELPFKGNSPYVGLCYVASVDDYKMVRIPTLPRRSPRSSSSEKISPLWIYSLNLDSWKKMDVLFSYAPLQSGPPTLFNECMHWITDEGLGLMIATFDAKNEVLGYMPLPDSDSEGTLNISPIMRQLAIIRGSLCVVVCLNSKKYNLVHEVWKMDEYGDEGSWRKQFVISEFPEIALPVGSWKDGNLLFRYYSEDENQDQLVSYDPFAELIEPFRVSRSLCLRVVNYQESLESVEGGSKRSSLGRQMMAGTEGGSSDVVKSKDKQQSDLKGKNVAKENLRKGKKRASEKIIKLG